MARDGQYYEQPRYIERRSSDDDRVKPKEVLGWAAILGGGYLAYKLFFDTGDEERRDKWMAEALKRFGYYKSCTTPGMFVAIAKKWDEDHKPDRLPSQGGTKILVGENAMKASTGICKAIYGAKGFFGDNENLLYVAISRIKNLAHFFHINEEWKRLYPGKGDFVAFIGGFTNAEEKIKCVVIWDQLPYYEGGEKRKIEKPKREWLKEL